MRVTELELLSVQVLPVKRIGAVEEEIVNETSQLLPELEKLKP